MYIPYTYISWRRMQRDASEISDSNIIGVGIPISFDRNRLRANVTEAVRHVRFLLHLEYFIYYHLYFSIGPKTA